MSYQKTKTVSGTDVAAIAELLPLRRFHAATCHARPQRARHSKPEQRPERTHQNTGRPPAEAATCYSGPGHGRPLETPEGKRAEVPQDRPAGVDRRGQAILPTEWRAGQGAQPTKWTDRSRPPGSRNE
ncbi:hypothetical protein Aca07nite_80590 [Actinoplanes capillaceus]|uniref:Uncharacterized protein n=1 Tax=Actinoplanes campanulatus TaxID=113559 RepID=A0ABQ3WWZ0_9ACTN|nr:hypothetical protein Aca07nite_80590 [Actinoplanes capillaceus]